jgi:hypothetical protein
MEQIQHAGAGFRSITEAVDTTPLRAIWSCKCLAALLNSNGRWSVNGPAPAWRPLADWGAKLGRPVLELLNRDERTRLNELAIFPEDTDVPLRMVEVLWVDADV